MSMLGVLGTSLPKEHNHRLTHHVEGGQTGSNHHHPKDPAMMLPRAGHDEILAIVTAEEGASRERQHAAAVGQESDRHLALQPPHLPDILLMVHPDDHGSGREEEETFEECVREEMEHRERRRDGKSCTGDHVAKL